MHFIQKAIARKSLATTETEKKKGNKEEKEESSKAETPDKKVIVTETVFGSKQRIFQRGRTIAAKEESTKTKKTKEEKEKEKKEKTADEVRFEGLSYFQGYIFKKFLQVTVPTHSQRERKRPHWDDIYYPLTPKAGETTESQGSALQDALFDLIYLINNN